MTRFNKSTLQINLVLVFLRSEKYRIMNIDRDLAAIVVEAINNVTSQGFIFMGNAYGHTTVYITKQIDELAMP